MWSKNCSASVSTSGGMVSVKRSLKSVARIAVPSIPAPFVRSILSCGLAPPVGMKLSVVPRHVKQSIGRSRFGRYSECPPMILMEIVLQAVWS